MLVCVGVAFRNEPGRAFDGVCELCVVRVYLFRPNRLVLRASGPTDMNGNHTESHTRGCHEPRPRAERTATRSDLCVSSRAHINVCGRAAPAFEVPSQHTQAERLCTTGAQHSGGRPTERGTTAAVLPGVPTEWAAAGGAARRGSSCVCVGVWVVRVGLTSGDLAQDSSRASRA